MTTALAIHARRVWTLDIRGGEPFTIAVLDNPPIEHDGKRTVCKLCLPPVELGLLLVHLCQQAAVKVLTECPVRRSIPATGRVDKPFDDEKEPER